PGARPAGRAGVRRDRALPLLEPGPLGPGRLAPVLPRPGGGAPPPGRARSRAASLRGRAHQHRRGRPGGGPRVRGARGCRDRGRLMPRPLQGIRVLEVGQLMAGPFAGTILGYFGAEVIKIEPPGAGDPVRSWRLMENGTSLWWASLGRNKKCISLDLRKEEGRVLA